MIRKPDDRMVLLSLDLQVWDTVSFIWFRFHCGMSHSWIKEMHSWKGKVMSIIILMLPASCSSTTQDSLSLDGGKGEWLILATLSSSILINHLLKLILSPNISQICPLLLSSCPLPTPWRSYHHLLLDYHNSIPASKLSLLQSMFSCSSLSGLVNKQIWLCYWPPVHSYWH